MRFGVKKFLVISLAIILLSACASEKIPPLAPTDTQTLPTAVPAPLYQQVTLETIEATETSQSPDFTITSRTPKLTGSDDPRVTAFNDLTASVVQKAISEFKNNLAEMQPLPDLDVQSTFDVGFTLFSETGNILSLQFTEEGYVEGAAHPYHILEALNFDLDRGAQITLDSLFQPGSDYLLTIANFCATELTSRDIGFTDAFTQGAAPLPENYQNWNIAPDGLLITFNEYQVAPYAAGHQTVTIPYADLASFINPQGALAQFLP